MGSSDRRLEPRRTPKQVRAELTRGRILTAAAHVFIEFGYAAGTTNRIAEQARISIGSLYQYFPNKDAILAELLVQHIDRGGWTGTEDFSPGTLEATIRTLVRAAIDNHRDDPHLLRLMLEEAPVSKALLETMDRHEKVRTAQLADVIARHPDTDVAAPELAAELILFTVEVNTHKFMAGPRAVPLDDFENELVAMVTRYLEVARPSPGTAPARAG